MATKMKSKKVLPLYSSTVGSKTSTKQQNQKKVEVRWLQSEAELYLKQWQRRYHQLEGIDDNCHQLSRQLSRQLEEYDDWCLTSQRILDLDLELIDNKNNINNNNTNFDLFWRREPKLIFNFDDSKSNSSAIDEEEEDVDEENNDVFESVENICCPNTRDNNRFNNYVINHNNCSDNETNDGFYHNIITKSKALSHY
jgi:hypothetical protein